MMRLPRNLFLVPCKYPTFGAIQQVLPSFGLETQAALKAHHSWKASQTWKYQGYGPF